MQVTKRQTQILELLLKSDKELTAKEMARVLNVSTRTIHRELTDIEAMLNGLGIQLVKQAGKGILIEATHSQSQRLKAMLHNADITKFHPEERKVLLLCHLLKTNVPSGFTELTDLTRSTFPTVQADLVMLRSYLRKFDLKLSRRHGAGVEITGYEAAKREVIADLALVHIEDSFFLGSIGETSSNPVSHQVLELVGHHNLPFVEKALTQLESIYPTQLSYSQYRKLVVQVTIALTRQMSGLLVSDHECTYSEEGSDYDTPFFRDAVRLLHKCCAPQEKHYLFRLLKGWCKIDTAADSSSLWIPTSQEQHTWVTSCIQEVGRRMGLDFTEDFSLLEGLLKHANELFQRLADKEIVRNSFLNHIKEQYAVLFEQVTAAVRCCKPSLHLSGDEIGFLVMHFGASIERIHQMPRRVTALIVCTSGIGSSNLLRVRIQKEMPQVDILDRISWYEASRVSLQDYDLLISTVDLPISTDKYIKLSPLLTEQEVDKLREFIRHNIVMKEKSAEGSDYQSSLRRMNSISKQLCAAIDIIEQFSIQTIDMPAVSSASKFTVAVQAICAYMEQAGLVSDPTSLMRLLLQNGEMKSSMRLMSKLAHVFIETEYINQPVFTLFKLCPADAHREQDELQHILCFIVPVSMERALFQSSLELFQSLIRSDGVRVLTEGQDADIHQFVMTATERTVKTASKALS